jgi:hypothetical protein
MKNLIVITANCPTEEQENMLEKCLDSVINLGHHILLISHTHIPIHIQKKCNYYFYDYFNDINDDDELLFFVRYVINDNTTIRSKYFTKEFYGFAIYRMFSMSSLVAENFKYENIHHIEYDCVIKNDNLINEHNELLETYDVVFYTDNGKPDGFLFGAFKSFKVNKLPELFKRYNKDEMRRMMVEIPLVPLETFTKHIFMEGGNVIIKNTNDIKNNGSFFQNESPLRLKYFTPYYDHTNDTFFLFYKNMGETTNSLRIYINDDRIYNELVKSKYWMIKNLCDSNELKSILIICDDKLIYDKKFTTEGVENLKKNAYLIIN